VNDKEKAKILYETQYLTGMLKDVSSCHGSTTVREQLERIISTNLTKLEGKKGV